MGDIGAETDRPSAHLLSLPRTLAALALLLLVCVPPAAASPVPIGFSRFGSGSELSRGTFGTTQLREESIELTADARSGAWTSPIVEPGFGFDRLVPSWNADTPAGSHVEVEARGLTATGTPTAWYVLGIWADGDAGIQRTSVNGQADDDAWVATDTLQARSLLKGYQLRVTLARDDPTVESPVVRLIAAVASRSSDVGYEGTSPSSGLPSVELPVPAYSQEIHARQYTQWGGGGEAWCSPTSTEMVVEYWGRGPSAEDLGWVDPRYADPSVVFAARHAYDTAYRGTGNWPFNTAYAARFGLEAFVTQLRSLAEAERFVRAGIPLVASVKVAPYGLDGFLFPGGTNGHLAVLVGFTDAGDPIVNDPAAPSDAAVRRVYDRGQLERAWLNGSAGIVYVIRPSDVPLPPPGDAPSNW